MAGSYLVANPRVFSSLFRTLEQLSRCGSTLLGECRSPLLLPTSSSYLNSDTHAPSSLLIAQRFDLVERALFAGERGDVTVLTHPGG